MRLSGLLLLMCLTVPALAQTVPQMGTSDTESLEVPVAPQPVVPDEIAPEVIAPLQTTEPQLGSEGTEGVVAQPEVPQAVPAAEPAAVAAAPATSEVKRFGGQDGVFRMMVIGDRMARGLGAGLERLTELDPRFEIITRQNDSSGLARPEVYDWAGAVPKVLKGGNFDGVLVFMGANDRQTIKVNSMQIEFGTPEWDIAYRSRVDALLARISGEGAKVYWVNLPPMQDPLFETDVRKIAELQRERVVAAGGQFLDLTGDLTDNAGSFLLTDVDDQGNEVRIRDRDGINFIKAGNTLISELVLSSIRLREGAGELAATGVEERPDASPLQEPEIPTVLSPVFGNAGINDEAITIEAQVIASTPAQEMIPDSSPLGKLGLKVARNSLAQRVYLSGEVVGAPVGRFDDFNVGEP